MAWLLPRVYQARRARTTSGLLDLGGFFLKAMDLVLRRHSGQAAGLAGNDQAALVGKDDELGAVSGVQLHEDARHMRFAGQRANEQALGDLGVGQARGDEPEDLDLPGGERG